MSQKETKKAEETSMKSNNEQKDESDRKQSHKITQMDLDMEEPE